MKKIFKNKFSKIVSIEKTELKEEDYLYYNKLIKVTSTICGIDNKTYYIVATLTNQLSYRMYIYTESWERIDDIQAMGKFFISNNNPYIDFGLIERRNPHYNRFGFAHLMMETLLIFYYFYEENNNFQFTRIIGTISANGGDDPKKSIPLYEFYDKTSYGKNKMLNLQKDLYNFETGGKLLYRIIEN